MRFEIGDPHRRVDLVLTANQLLHPPRLARELVLVVANNFLENVFEGDYPFGAAILVDDDGHLLPTALEFLEQIAQ
jgi:hypothetical protein